MAKKKTPRKKLLKEPDEFITFGSRLLRFIMEHKIQVFGGVGLFIAAGVIYSGAAYFSARAEEKAFALLEKEKARYAEQLEKGDPAAAYNAVKEDVRGIIEKYPDKQGGKMARVTLADMAFEADDIETAIELHKRALQDFENEPAIRNALLSGLGHLYEKKGDVAAAVTYFEKIASGDNRVLKDEALFNLGRLYASTGKVEESREAFSKIVSDFTDSVYFELAKEKESLLAAKI